jgi:hypothetical protein
MSQIYKNSSGGGGGGDVDSLTPDVGGAVTPTGGTIPTLGYQAGTVQTMRTYNDGAGNFRIADQSWQTQYVVDPSTTNGLRGTFTTIQSAINQAVSDGASISSDKTIFIRYGSYTENLTIPPGIYLKGEASLANPLVVSAYTTITGNHTLGNTNLFRASGLYFVNPSSTLDLFTSGTSNIFEMNDCGFNNTTSSGLMFTINFNYSKFTECVFIENVYETSFDVTSVASVTFERCQFSSAGITSAGDLTFYSCIGIGPITMSANGIVAENSTFSGSTFCVTGTGQIIYFTNCEFAVASTNAPIQYTGTHCGLINCSTEVDQGLPGIYDDTTVVHVSNTTCGNVFPRTLVDDDVEVDQTECYIGVTDTSSPRTVTLVASVLDRFWTVKDESLAASVNNITVNVDGGGLIDGAATYVINQDGGAATFISDGAGNYYVMNQAKASSGSSFSPVYFAASLSAPQAVAASSTAATIIFDNVTTNVGSGYNGATGVFTAPSTGYYSFSATIYFNNLAAAVGATQTILAYTGSAQSLRLIQQGIGATVTNNAIILNASWDMVMTAGDTVQMQPFADGTGNYEIFGAALSPTAFSNTSTFGGFRAS